MSDLISRQAAIEIASGFCHPANIAKELAKLPSAQPDLEEAYICGEMEAEARYHDYIVRCKDCKYNSNMCGNYVNCDIIPQMFGRTTDNFCSRAERRTDE